MKNIKTDKPNVNVKMDMKLLERLRALAKENDRSVAAQIRFMIAKLLA